MATKPTEHKPVTPSENPANPKEGEVTAALQDEQKKPAKKTELAILNFVVKYLKLVGGALLIWFMGWLGLSYVWIIAGFFIYVLWRMNQDERKSRRDAFREATEKEQQVVEARMEDLPSWVRQTRASACWLVCYLQISFLFKLTTWAFCRSILPVKRILLEAYKT